MDSKTPIIGKSVIESLTTGMYDDPRFVYREYIQNAADQIDKAIAANLYESHNDAHIYIQIYKEENKIIIEDNATGIESDKVLPYLGNIALSPKNKYKDKGFRGIGRLGGLGYCDRLTFETSYKGEMKKSTMTWNAKQLKEVLNDTDYLISAAELVSLVTSYSFVHEEKDEHYFKITMEGVTNEELINVDKVREYLSMVAPLPFGNGFPHKDKIYKEAKEKNIKIDEYNLFLNSEQLFKGYKNSIYKKDGVNKEDEIIDIVFFEEYWKEELLFWGWYGISNEMHQIPENNIERGIRLRQKNIQIGLEDQLDKYHKNKMGNSYFVGEVYAINPELTPNARRDSFVDNIEFEIFEKQIKNLFHEKLYALYRDFSTKNSAINKLQQLEALYKKVKDKNLDKDKKQKFAEKIPDAEDKAEKAKSDLTKLEEKYKGEVLSKIIVESSCKFNIERPKDIHKIIPQKKLSAEQTAFLEKIYAVIRKNLINETAEELIRKIEEEVKKR